MTQKIYEYFEGTARYTKALSVTEDSGQKTDGVTDNPSTREKEKKEMRTKEGQNVRLYCSRAVILMICPFVCAPCDGVLIVSED